VYFTGMVYYQETFVAWHDHLCTHLMAVSLDIVAVAGCRTLKPPASVPCLLAPHTERHWGHQPHGATSWSKVARTPLVCASRPEETGIRSWKFLLWRYISPEKRSVMVMGL
jgi:hypothetical protein